MSPSTQAAICLLFVLIVAALLVARRSLRETTLIATWWWSLAAVVAIVGCDLLVAWRLIADNATATSLSFAARMLILCPTISLIGAKRPQDGPWNLIVVSLWAVLALPAAEALFLNSGQPPEIQGFRSWFIVVLIVVTLVNTIPTRHALASLAVVGGQIFLLGDFLPVTIPGPRGELLAIGLGLIALATVLFAVRPTRSAAAHSLDRLWLDFRDSFGLFWGLRVQERLLAAAKMYDWPVSLHWTGWATLEGQPLQKELSAQDQDAILTTFRGLLRRFVSNEWIDERSS